jgi:hypothetical protein
MHLLPSGAGGRKVNFRSIQANVHNNNSCHRIPVWVKNGPKRTVRVESGLPQTPDISGRAWQVS